MYEKSLSVDSVADVSTTVRFFEKRWRSRRSPYVQRSARSATSPPFTRDSIQYTAPSSGFVMAAFASSRAACVRW